MVCVLVFVVAGPVWTALSTLTIAARIGEGGAAFCAPFSDIGVDWATYRSFGSTRRVRTTASIMRLPVKEMPFGFYTLDGGRVESAEVLEENEIGWPVRCASWSITSVPHPVAQALPGGAPLEWTMTERMADPSAAAHPYDQAPGMLISWHEGPPELFASTVWAEYTDAHLIDWPKRPIGGIVIPTRWSALGVAINSAFYGGLSVLVLLAWRSARRAWRRRRGRCPACAYDLRGLGGGGVCPECGVGFSVGRP